MKFLFHDFFGFCFVLLESIDGRGDYGKTPNAFIFSLNNFEGLAPFVSKVKKDKIEKAINKASGTGPMFGQDLVIHLDDDKVWRSNAHLIGYYSPPPLVTDALAVLDGHKGNFSPDEVEVFYLDPSR